MLSILLLIIAGALLKWAGCVIIGWTIELSVRRNISCVPIPLPDGAVPMRHDSWRKGGCRGCGALPGVWCSEDCHAA